MDFIDTYFNSRENKSRNMVTYLNKLLIYH